MIQMDKYLMPILTKLSMKESQKFYLTLIVMCLSLIMIYNFGNVKTNDGIINGKIMHKKFKNPYNDVEIYFARRKNWNTSSLGSMLFKNEVLADRAQRNRTYKILVWKYWKWLENRHVFNYDEKRKSDPLNKCSVNNCIFSGQDEEIDTADAVVIHIQRGILPNVTSRNKNQRWIFLSDESPKNSFSMAQAKPKLRDLAGVFNWSMTYRSDSDVPVPYGRTIPLQTPLLDLTSDLGELVPFWEEKRRDVYVTILISNCGVSRRMNYIKELQKYIPVDIYGKCSKDHKKSCPGHFSSDCKVIAEYVFYLVFENSECHEYLTEKGFYHAYSKGAIPIIMGPTVEDCEALLPPKSFLHVDNYKSAKDLANHIMYLSVNDENILEYHNWRKNFDVANEHGYFGSPSFHYCRVCEALNYNDESEKIYDEEMIKLFFDENMSCR